MSEKLNNGVATPNAARLRALSGRTARLALPGAALGLAAMVGGCSQSFMDPSVTGKWSPTPVVMPILDRIAAIEDDSGELVETSDPVPGDLVPLPMSYRIGAGDQLDVTLYDLIETNRPELYTVVVDARGAIELPQLGRIVVSGMTTEEITEVLKTAMKRLVSEPLVLVVAKAQRQQTFNIVGAVESPGPYFIPRADYRLLEAITAGGRFDESIEEVFIIRQVPLSDDVTKGAPAGETLAANGAAPAAGTPDKSGKDLVNVIDSIAPPTTPTPPTTPNPGTDKPAGEPAPAPAVPMPGEPAAKPAPVQPTAEPKPAPVIDLVDQSKPAAPKGAPAAPAGQNQEESSWVFVNGKWTQMSRGGAAAADGKPARPMQDMITQRIIKVPTKPLLAGKQSVNVIVRPGDVIHVPAAPTGLIYVSGQVARPGPYQLPSSGGLTLLRALDSAGGLGTIAIPERIDITRLIGRDRQATIMLDGRAIAEQTQPDLYLRPNDRINVGTNFWALPLAVIRNGFRASYGFGFVLDRNIGNDLLGPPPVNTIGQ